MGTQRKGGSSLAVVLMMVVATFATWIVQVPAVRGVTYFSEDFDGGVGAWTVTGAWHEANASVPDPCYGNPVANHPAAPASTPISIAFHFDASPPAMPGLACTYDMDNGTGVSAAHAGNLTSPPVNLTGAPGPVWLHFSTWRQTDGLLSTDQMLVLVDPGSGPAPVHQVVSPVPPQTAWETVDVNLTAFAGGMVNITFRFDTVDNVSNAFAGWYVDDVLVDDVPPITNSPPVADAGTNQVSFRGVTVVLDGTGSYDPDGDPITYNWTQVSGPETVTITNPTASLASFVPTQLGAYVFNLTVTDDQLASDTDATTVVTINRRPVANAGPDMAAIRNVLTSLDGRGSSDPDGDPLTYAWIQTSGPTVTLTGATTATPTFTPTQLGAYVFELTVNDTLLDDTDEVVVTVGNRAPVANAGPDQVQYRGVLVTLDGRGSSDPDGDSLTYAWIQTSGPTVTLTGATTATPTFTPTQLGTYVFELTVNDTLLDDTDEVVVTVANRAPVANAGGDQTGVLRGALVTLNGSGSSDPDGDALAFTWAQTSGPPVALVGATTAVATFVPLVDGVYAVRLTVEDSFGGVAFDTVRVFVVNRLPTADAGPDQNVLTGVLVTLDGTASGDPDGDVLGFVWVQTVGLTVALTGADTASPTFTPAQPGTYVFNLTVDDGFGGTDEDSVTITAGNRPPVADAGPDQSGQFRGALVRLDGSGSTDPEGGLLNLTWAQVSGPSITLSSAFAVKPTFTPAQLGTYTFSLTARDPLNATNTDEVVVIVEDRSPVAIASAPPTAAKRALVTLDGTDSFDPDGDPLGYAWSQSGGPTVSIGNANGATATFTPSLSGTYEFELTVNDGLGGSGTSAPVRVVVANLPPVADAGEDQAAFRYGLVTLAGGGADPDGDALAFAWTQVSGPAVTLSDANAASPTFTPNLLGTCVFAMAASDGDGGISTDTVVVTVLNRAPVANAGPDQEVDLDATVTLTAAASTDPDGDTLTYVWTQMAGPAAALSSANAASPAFTATEDGILVFLVTVSDGHGGSATDLVQVVVLPGPSEVEAFPMIWVALILIVVVFLLLAVLLLRRRRKEPEAEEGPAEEEAAESESPEDEPEGTEEEGAEKASDDVGP